MAVRKKNKVRTRPKTGLAGAPFNNGFEVFNYYVYMEVDRKDIAEITKDYIKNQYSKEDAKAILANPEYNFSMYSLHGSAIYWVKILEQELPNNYKNAIEKINKFYSDLIESGKEILKKKSTQATTKSNVIVLNPQQRFFRKNQDTIMSDLDDFETSWINDEDVNFDIYQSFKKHGLANSHIAPVLKRLENWLIDYNDAYHKRCNQAIEGYSHIKRTVLRRRIKMIEDMIADLDKVKASTAAIRKPRTIKPRSADRQVAQLKYCKENLDFKITSILPIALIGSMRLYVFNIKTKELTEYVSSSTKGFEVKGTTLQNIGDASRKIKLRKPEEILPIVQTKSIKQIDNMWQNLTTKTNSPNGRLNSDCILLRVLNK